MGNVKYFWFIRKLIVNMKHWFIESGLHILQTGVFLYQNTGAFDVQCAQCELWLKIENSWIDF